LAIVALCGCLAHPAGATVPFDHRPTGPNQSSELPGAGYLLTDPFQGPSQAYWAGAYRTIPGARSYCIDDYYDYPNASYGYVAPEVASWPGRPGSNLGASGHTAERVIWIVNSYGASTSASTDAAVSMAINLLTGSQPFNRSYYGYFRAQLNAIDGTIVPLINRMISDSDRYAGPYRTEVRPGVIPKLGGAGTFAVLVRSALGLAVPWAPITVSPGAGVSLSSPRSGTTGHGGVATIRYVAARAGVLALSAHSTAVPNTTMRLGYSPSHNTGNFNSGSQRVALASAHRLVPTAPGSARVRVTPPTVRTIVDGGSMPRTVGESVSDRVLASGLTAGAKYALSVRLTDANGVVCGDAALTVAADRRGSFDVHTARIPVCGGLTDTFTERLVSGRVTVAVTPPGVPSETFPVAPSISTAVQGGNGPRTGGSAVVDEVHLAGLAPATDYRLLASLVDDSGRTCAHLSVPIRSDQHGVLDIDTQPLRVCGVRRDSFVEQVLDGSGTVLVLSKPWVSSEWFPISPPPVATKTPVPETPVGHTPAPAPPTAPVHKTVQLVSSPKPQLPNTGAAPMLALVTGLFGVAIGGLVLIAGRRSS
jgi:hypothetical protein